MRRRRAPGEPPVPDDVPTNPIEVFRALARHDVEYLTIGGVAVQAHGHQRTTRDVDLVVNPDPDNLARLGEALRELRARIGGVDGHLLGIDPTDAHALAEGANFLLATSAGPLDVWTDPAELAGAAPFEEMRARAQEAVVHDVPIPIAGRDDLIAMKRASAPNRASDAKREQDLNDIAVLAMLDRPPGASGGSEK
jgi:hypothetical protein